MMHTSVKEKVTVICGRTYSVAGKFDGGRQMTAAVKRAPQRLGGTALPFEEG